MGRKPGKKHPKRRDNLKKLMELEGISTVEMERLIHDRTGKTFQYQCIGRCVEDGDAFDNLTEERASDVIEAFPKYRIQWLLGYDDYMTNADLVFNAVDERKRKQALFATIAEMSGWGINDLESTLSVDLQGLPTIGEETDDFPYARISNGEAARNLDQGDFERLVSKMVDYFKFELEHTCFDYEREHTDEANPAR